MTQEEEIAHLKKQLSEVVERLSKAEARESQLLAQVSAMQAENHVLHEHLAVAHKRIEELEKQKTPPPAFVKANVVKPKAEEKKQRKKRNPQHNRARRREAPTVVVEHRIKHCPVCANALGGISVARRRQVIELPPPPPVEVTEHVVYHGWCRKSWDVARSSTGCESGSGGAGTLRGEDCQPDQLFADCDAFAGATDSSLSGQLARPIDQ